MVAGLRTFDPATGAIKNTVTTRLTRILGTIDVNANGSVVDVGFSTGAPWACILNTEIWGEAENSYELSLIFSWSGNTMSWVSIVEGVVGFPSGGVYNLQRPLIVMYGVY